MRIRYNAPVTLTYTFFSAVVLGLSLTVLPSLTASWFSTPSPFHADVFQDWVRLFSHVMGHASIEHYISNFTMILLLGPILELAYGSLPILLMTFATALLTGVLNVFLFPGTSLMGASGVVFMMIMLSSITNFRKGELPLTFILVLVIYLGGQVWNAVAKQDNVSQFTHIIGGLLGSLFGFVRARGGEGKNVRQA